MALSTRKPIGLIFVPHPGKSPASVRILGAVATFATLHRDDPSYATRRLKMLAFGTFDRIEELNAVMTQRKEPLTADQCIPIFDGHNSVPGISFLSHRLHATACPAEVLMIPITNMIQVNPIIAESSSTIMAEKILRAIADTDFPDQLEREQLREITPLPRDRFREKRGDAFVRTPGFDNQGL